MRTEIKIIDGRAWLSMDALDNMPLDDRQIARRLERVAWELRETLRLRACRGRMTSGCILPARLSPCDGGGE